MKLKLTLTKSGRVLVDDTFEVGDADAFADACRTVWMRLEQRGLDRTTSVGAFMEMAGESVAHELAGAELVFAAT